jgi:hypothetical protein
VSDAVSSLIRDIESEALGGAASRPQKPAQCSNPWELQYPRSAAQHGALLSSFVCPGWAFLETDRWFLTGGDGDRHGMTLSLISLLSQDVTALWLLLKTSAGASGSARSLNPGK